MSVVNIMYSAIGGAEAPIKLAPKPKYVDDDDVNSDEDDDAGSYNEEDDDNDNDNEPSSSKPKLASLQKVLPSKKIGKPLRDDEDEDDDGDGDGDGDGDESYYDENEDDDEDDDVDPDDDEDTGIKRSKPKRGKRGADEDEDEDEDEMGTEVDDDVVSDDESAIHDDDGDDDDDGQDGEKYKKINSEFRKNYITETHPEVESHTDDEIHAFAKVVRNKAGIIVDPLHKTTPLLTKYEKTRIVGIRTKQLNNGATPYVSSKAVLGGAGAGLGNAQAHKAQVIDGYAIALRELEEKKLPFIIRRPLPNGGTEYWYLQDLEVL
jgi:DNA-directed RNA polymerase subunit K/omega